MAGIISLILCSAGTAFAAGTIQYGNVRFKHLDGSDGLPHNTVYSITQDDYGFMWFATAGGLCRYDGYDVTVFLHKEGDSSSLRHDFVRNLYNDPYRQSIWISTETGVCRYDYGEDIFCSYDIEGNRSDNVRFLVTGKEHGLLAVCSNGIFRYDAGKDVFEPFIRRPGHVFYTAAEDSSSMLWITTNKGLLCYDLLRSAYTDIPDTLSDLGKIWIEADMVCGTGLILCNDNDYYVYNTASDRLTDLSSDLKMRIFRCAQTDSSGNIWIGTEYGIYVYDSSWELLAHYQQSAEDLSGLDDSPVYSIFRDTDGNMWAGTYFGGVNYFVSGSDQFKIWPYGSSRNRLSGKAVRQIENAPDGGLYVATEDGGLNHIDTGGRITRSGKIHGIMGIDAKNVHSLLADEDGSLWIGLFLKGVLHYMPDKGRTADYSVFTDEVSSGFDISRDSEGNIWYAGPSGLFRIDRKKMDRAPERILSQRLLDIAVSDDSTLWVGARKGGIYTVDTRTCRVERLPSFSDDRLHVTDIFRDSRGMMWVATDHDGLYETDRTGKTINFYGKEQIGSGSVKSIIEDRNGNFWAGTGNGLVFINGKDRTCTRYTTMLEGVDKDWQDIGNQHQVRLTGLRAGNYVFKVKAGNDGVNWDEANRIEFGIRILPPWYASPAAFLIYAAAVMFILWSVYRWYRMRLRLRMKLEAEHERRLNTEKMNRAKTDFFTYVSHDLKTPLTLILSPLQHILENSELNEEDRNMLSVVYKNADRMNYLVKELLTFSKIEMKQKKILVRKGDIMGFLDETSGIFGMVARERDIDFVVNLERGGEKVWFSPSSLERILFNLLSNAFKYTDAGGCVTLEAHLDSGSGDTTAVISVKDTGRGIPQDSLRKIFDSYYQVERKDHREGFGLGLALTRSLIKMHKGDIKVSSEVGKGTEFTVTLNVSENAFSEEERSSESITSDEIKKYNRRIQDTLELVPDRLHNTGQNGKTDTLLVVEDSEEMNGYITGIFSKKYRVLRAYNGEEALEILSGNIPDIIISDVMMPKMDGLKMLDRIRNDVSTCHIPVVLLTAKTDETDHTEGYLKGADAYIDKPFSARNLELLVNNIIAGRQRNIEHFRKTGEVDVKQITSNPRDEAFMEKLVKLIMDNIREEKFGVAEITAQMNVSRSLLHMKLKALAGCSITQFIRNIKMKEARTCLANGMNVSEAAYAVGMTDPNYFTKCFKAEFNITPTEYLKSIRK